MHSAIRAERIMTDLDRQGLLFAVYDKQTPLQYLESIASRMNEFQTVQALAVTGSIYVEGGSTLVPMVAIQLFVGKCSPEELIQIFRMFKQLTQPKLSIGMGTLRLELTFCACRRLELRVKALSFIFGFEPEDLEAFQLWFLAGLQKFPLTKLVNADPQPPFIRLAIEVERLLISLGAATTDFSITHKLEETCTHT
jgi:hypothetical protein